LALPVEWLGSGKPPDWRADGSPAFTPASTRLKPRGRHHTWRDTFMGSVIKKRRKRMAKKKHRKLLRKTRVARRKAGK
jgi:hypothetical protein